MEGSLLVAGTGSDVGKSVLVAGIVRLFARNGVQVAPFKAQNMSNNSMVCGDGGEIGRAQWLQAIAAGVEPEVAMNPVLLKPGSDHISHVVLLGEPDGELPAERWQETRQRLADVAYASFAELRRRFDVVVCEGAGSLAEVNLRAGDFVNLGLAARFGIPVVVVGDIDRGGVLAAMVGHLRAARRRRPCAARGVDRQQVPWRPRAAGAGPRRRQGTDGPARARRAAVARRRVAGRRGRPPRRRLVTRVVRIAAARGGRPPSPCLQRHRRGRASGPSAY